MKKILLYISITFAAIGCTKEETESTIPTAGEINFSAGVTTRVDPTNDCAWSTTGSDEVGVFTNQPGESNLLFSVDKNGAMTSDSKLYPLAEGTRTYYAYHPYSSAQNSTNISIDHTQDEPTVPLLWASVEDSNADNVTFIFSHKLAKVTFNIAAGGVDVSKDYNFEDATVTLKDANAIAVFGVESGEFLDAYTKVGDIDLSIVKVDDKYEIIAYLIPTAIISGSIKLWITADGNTYIYPINTASWVGGCQYEYDIAVGETDIHLKDDGCYYINTAAGLKAFADLVNGRVNTTAGTIGNITFSQIALPSIEGKLTRNIDLSGEAWTPIGTSSSTPYTGLFDGCGYLVSGLNVSSNVISGLFGCTGSDARISNLGASGSVSGYYSGGVVGNNSGTITNCYNMATVSGSGNVGGVVGLNSGVIYNCYNMGDVSGSEKIGGVVGWNSSNCINCYSSGSVNVNIGHYAGGVAGGNSGTITCCYWNKEIFSGDSVGYSRSGTISQVTGYTTAVMRNREVYYANSIYYFYDLLNSNAAYYNDIKVNAQDACAWISTSGNYPALDFDTVPDQTTN